MLPQQTKESAAGTNWVKKYCLLFSGDLNRGCLVYIFSLRFLGSQFLINSRRQFRVRKTFRVCKICGT